MQLNRPSTNNFQVPNLVAKNFSVGMGFIHNLYIFLFLFFLAINNEEKEFSKSNVKYLGIFFLKEENIWC